MQIESSTKTHHAQVRQQQRGIPQFVVDLIVEFGCERPAGDGCISIFLDKKGRKELERYLSKAVYAKIREHLNYYVILSEAGVVVTMAVIH
tara:strand:+ start:393 stop:665 length:273 start_codon:yes stop_codon:yes gene_type:complete